MWKRHNSSKRQACELEVRALTHKHEALSSNREMKGREKEIKEAGEW
jgi:hypothetical protein